jgi:tetratricopeptide (TPR) repeat protein
LLTAVARLFSPFLVQPHLLFQPHRPDQSLVHRSALSPAEENWLMNSNYFKYRLFALVIVLPIVLILRAAGVLPQKGGWKSRTSQTQKELDDQDKFDGFYEKGVAALKSGDQASAVDYFSRALKIDPDDAGAHINRGIALEQRQEYDRALADYNEGIRLDPDSPESYYNRGLYFFHRQEYDRALADLNEAIKRDPQMVDYLLERGSLYGVKKDWDRAVADFTEAIRLDPQKLDAYTGRGLAYEHRRDLQKALADYSEAVRLDPNHAEARRQRGMVYALLGDADHALEDLNQAVTLDPKSPDMYVDRGWAYEKKKAYEQAINDYTTALKFDEKHVHACNNLAWIWATCPNKSLRNGKSALEFADYACRLTEWKDASLFDTLAAAYAELGKFEEAVQWQKKAVAAPDAFEDKEEAKKAATRLKLYEAGKSFTDD